MNRETKGWGEGREIVDFIFFLIRIVMKFWKNIVKFFVALALLPLICN